MGEKIVAHTKADLSLEYQVFEKVNEPLNVTDYTFTLKLYSTCGGVETSVVSLGTSNPAIGLLRFFVQKEALQSLPSDSLYAIIAVRDNVDSLVLSGVLKLYC